MKLSVIIPCYNAAETISYQLKAFSKEKWSEPWEVIVVNNRSTDSSMIVAERFKRIMQNLRIISAEKRQGQPYALNEGVRAAIGEAVAFCDADDIISPGWVSAMGVALTKYDFVACRMDTEKLNSPRVQKSRGNSQKNGLPRIWYPPYLNHAGGGTLGIKRSLCLEIGEFDETLPCLHDTDYCFRIQQKGTKLHFVSKAVTHIRFRDSLADVYCQARNYAKYNVLVAKRYAPEDIKNTMKTLLLWKQYSGKWLRQIKSIPQLFNKDSRGKWFWSLGWQIGRLQGSLKNRVPPI